MSSILTLDKNYQPHRWVSVEDAIVLESKELVVDRLGESIVIYHGGTNRITGQRSFIETSSIIVVDGAPNPRKYHHDPVLTNHGLFQRDLFICAYCGDVFKTSDLTRDHIYPQSKGGRDIWMNVVTSCKDCNSMKGDTLPGHKLPFGMLGPQLTGKIDLLYVPYVPCKAEHLLMKNRNVKIDQMKFLLERVKNKSSRIFDYAISKFGDNLNSSSLYAHDHFTETSYVN
jgi:hypothetical protein